MMKRKYIICLLLIFAGISCKKEDNDCRGTKYSYLSETLIPFKFHKGSYWVYENDSTGALDSVAVTGIETGFIVLQPPIHGGCEYDAEYYKINMVSSATGQSYNDFLCTAVIKRNGGGYYGEEGQPIYLKSDNAGFNFYGMEKVASFSSMTFNGHIFYNVDKIKINKLQQYQQEFVHDTYLYYIPYIGLIKKEIYLGNGIFESWSIKRWQIVF